MHLGLNGFLKKALITFILSLSSDQLAEIPHVQRDCAVGKTQHLHLGAHGECRETGFTLDDTEEGVPCWAGAGLLNR